jgi:hypothetical protein
MELQNGASSPTPKACQNLAHTFLLTISPAVADLGVLLWIA